MKTNWIALFAAAVLLQLSAGAAMNATSAPKLTLAFDTKTNNSDGSVDVTFKVLNTSTTTGGNAPVINTVTLLVSNSISGATASYSVSSQILVGSMASTSFHFAPGTYYPPSTPGTTVWTFEAQGFADDHIFGDIALGPGQHVVSNDLVVNDRAQPPQFSILGNCTYEGTLSFTPLNFGYKGGTASLIIDTEVTARNASPAGCPWITGIVQNYPTGNISPSSGYGPAIGASAPTITVFPNVQLNTSTTARTMNVTMGGAFGNTYSGSFPVAQDGLTCAWTVTGFNPAQGGYTTSNPGVLQVNTGPDCLWSVTNTQGQIVILNPSTSYTGSTTLAYIVQTNNTCNSRNFSVSLGNITATATQPGLSCITAVVGTNMPGPSFLVDGSSYTGPQTFQWTSGSTHRLNVNSPQTPAPGTQYRFASWSQGGGASQTVAPSTNVTYTANFATCYQLTTAASPANEGTVAPASGAFYKAGTALVVYATPVSGFNFLSWTGPVSDISNPQARVVMNAPVSVTANFTSQPVAVLTLSTIPTGLSVIADGQTYTGPRTLRVLTGTSHQLSVASPQPGKPGTQYAFSSWSQGGAQTQTVTPNADAVYTASFDTQYQLSTSVWVPGTGAVSPAGTAYYTAGTTVPVTATPAPGFVFVGWAAEPLLAPTPSTNFSMTRPRSEFAVFAQPIQEFPLRVNAGPSYTDPAGNLWLGGNGTWFFGGAPAASPYFAAGGTNTPDLYQNEQTSSGPLEFRAPIPNGSYQVKLKSADDGPGDTAAFNIYVNGVLVLTNLDRHYVVGQYPVQLGAGNAAFDEVIPAQVTSGVLRLRWNPLSGHQAAINAIEVTPVPVRINAGGPAYTAPDGTRWSADTSTAGLVQNTTSSIKGTTTPALYQTQRYNPGGSLEYTFPLGNGTYVVRLKFAELQFQSAGQRVFNVYVNNLIAEHLFDPFAAAGGSFTAIDKVETLTVTNENLDIRLDAVVGNPAIAAIEILPSTDIRIKAGGPGLSDVSFFSNSGVLWDGDHNFSSGQSLSSTLPAGQYLYQSVRYNSGPLDYNFLVPNGQYFVLLKFAEIQNPSAGNTFNVSINGASVLSNFNALAAAGAAFTPIDKSFKTAVKAGRLNIHFDGQPEIAAIEIHSLLPDGSWEPPAVIAPNPPVIVP